MINPEFSSSDLYEVVALNASSLQDRGSNRFSPEQAAKQKKAARAGRVFRPVDMSKRPDHLETGRYMGRVLRASK